MDGHVDHAGQLLSQHERRRIPVGGKKMMCLVHQDPMRSAGFCAQLLEPRDKPEKERRAVLKRQADQVHHDAVIRLVQSRENLLHARAALNSAQHHGLGKRLIVAFRIDHIKLITTLGQAFQDSGRNRGFAAARGAGQQQIASRRVE